MKASVDGRTHQVTLFEPVRFAADPLAGRFLAVLEVVLSTLPVRPNWN